MLGFSTRLRSLLLACVMNASRYEWNYGVIHFIANECCDLMGLSRILYINLSFSYPWRNHHDVAIDGISSSFKQKLRSLFSSEYFVILAYFKICIRVCVFLLGKSGFWCGICYVRWIVIDLR